MPPLLARHFLPLTSALLLLGGCRREPPLAVSPAATTSFYEGRGVVRKVDSAHRKTVISHEAIAGYMEAMTMEFDVADATALQTLAPGDEVKFRLAVGETHGWIESLTKFGHVELPPEATRVAAPTLIEVGDALPECALIDEHGRTFRLSDYRGRAFAFTFIYTRCPFPDYCPLIANRFAEVQRTLHDTGQPEDYSLLSITIDPERDTPAVLADYAHKIHAEDDRWHFATGDAAQLEKLSSQFGLTVVREGAVLNHNLRTVVVDPTGRVWRIFTGNAWPATDLTTALQQAKTARP